MIIRVFPTKTNATPDDENVRFDVPTIFDEADKVEISVTFSWDLPKAEYLESQWKYIAPTFIGGPATGQQSEEFISGKYIKKGYTITSRGCPNKCWFCTVWRREGAEVRELPIVEGWNVLDDNLLACSQLHIKSVFDMLRKQTQPIEFTGGLEAKRFEGWHVDLLESINLKQAFFAYDTPDDWEPLVNVSEMIKGCKISTGHKIRSYVLIGWPKDTIDNATQRLKSVCSLGIMPMAMLYRDKQGKTTKQWRQFQREWANPFIVGSKMRKTP